MELFNLYVQVLLSQAIDPTFFATIEQGQGLCLMSFMLQLAASSLIHSLHSYCKFGSTFLRSFLCVMPLGIYSSNTW